MKPKCLLVFGLLIIASLTSFAQSGAYKDSVINAMSKLSFLTGHWEGTFQWIQNGEVKGSSDETIEITSKNGGTIIQLDATIKLLNANGTKDTATINVMQIFSYEPRLNKYLVKSYSAWGKQMEEVATLLNDNTIQHSFGNDPDWHYGRTTITVQNNKWKEVTESSNDGNNWQKSMETNLMKK